MQTGLKSTETSAVYLLYVVWPRISIHHDERAARKGPWQNSQSIPDSPVHNLHNLVGKDGSSIRLEFVSDGSLE